MKLICKIIGHEYLKYGEYVSDEVKQSQEDITQEIWKSIGTSFYCKRCFDQKMYHLNFTRTKQ